MEKGKTDLRVKVFPADLKAQLKSEAALKGITMQDYIIQILRARKAGKA
jgi:predicted DNA binding CopG/RHH family protein